MHDEWHDREPKRKMMIRARHSSLSAWTLTLTATISLLTSGIANAGSLLDSFELAKNNDAAFQAATYEKLAEDNTLRIAWSNLLPEASAEASYTRTRQDVQSSDNQVFAVGSTSFPVKTYGATLTQPLFRMTEWAEVSQARAGVRQAAAELDVSFQDLVLRTADAYFSVLEAREELEIREREREALERQVEITRRRLDSGMGTAPDVYEAEARFALAEADEVVARFAVSDAIQSLAEITGEFDDDLVPLAEELPLAPPDPGQPELWVRTALTSSPAVEARRQAVVVANREIDIQRSGHLPTVDFTASVHNRDTDGSLFGGGSQVETSEYGVLVRVPLFSGGSTVFGTRRARDLHRRNEQLLIAEQRRVERQTRDAFQAIGSAAQRVQALRKSVEVQRRAVDGREKAVRAGVDSVINVLNAERELYAAMRDYSRGRFLYVKSVLRLEQAVGALGVEDLEQVSKWLR
jgi:outer membrane protein